MTTGQMQEDLSAECNRRALACPHSPPAQSHSVPTQQLAMRFMHHACRWLAAIVLYGSMSWLAFAALEAIGRGRWLLGTIVLTLVIAALFRIPTEFQRSFPEK